MYTSKPLLRLFIPALLLLSIFQQLEADTHKQIIQDYVELLTEAKTVADKSASAAVARDQINRSIVPRFDPILKRASAIGKPKAFNDVTGVSPQGMSGIDKILGQMDVLDYPEFTKKTEAFSIITLRDWGIMEDMRKDFKEGMNDFMKDMESSMNKARNEPPFEAPEIPPTARFYDDAPYPEVIPDYPIPGPFPTPPASVRTHPIRGKGDDRTAKVEIRNTGNQRIKHISLDVHHIREDGSLLKTSPYSRTGFIGYKNDALPAGRPTKTKSTASL